MVWLTSENPCSRATAAAQAGLGTLLLQIALAWVFSLVQMLLDLVRHPALSLTQPLLGLLALALLAWTRQLTIQRRTRS